MGHDVSKLSLQPGLLHVTPVSGAEWRQDLVFSLTRLQRRRNRVLRKRELENLSDEELIHNLLVSMRSNLKYACHGPFPRDNSCEKRRHPRYDRRLDSLLSADYDTGQGADKMRWSPRRHSTSLGTSGLSPNLTTSAPVAREKLPVTSKRYLSPNHTHSLSLGSNGTRRRGHSLGGWNTLMEKPSLNLTEAHRSRAASASRVSTVRPRGSSCNAELRGSHRHHHGGGAASLSPRPSSPYTLPHAANGAPWCCIPSHPGTYRYVLQRYPSLCEAIVRQNPMALALLPPECRTTRVCIIAVSLNGEAFGFVPSNAREYLRIGTCAINHSSDAIKHISLRSDCWPELLNIAKSRWGPQAVHQYLPFPEDVAQAYGGLTAQLQNLPTLNVREWQAVPCSLNTVPGQEDEVFRWLRQKTSEG